MENKKINISVIAQMAGVSVSAVSRFLNNGYLSEDKKEAIGKAIKETGYKPSKQAQILRTRKTKLIGVIVPKLSSEAVARVVDGISTQIDTAGYQMLFADSQNNIEKELDYISLFDRNPVDGIVLLGTEFTKLHRNLFKKLSVPIVIVGQQFSGFSSIFHDDLHASYDLTERLINAGCSHIGYIGVDEKDIAAGYNRFNGYKQALEAHKIKYNPKLYQKGRFDLESGYSCAGRLFEKDGELDGIFCATDTIAIGAMQKIQEKKLSIPNDVKIVGIGHNRLSRVVKPRLTTAHYYYKESGMQSVKLLLKMIEEGVNEPENIQLEYQIIDGETV